jgi:hypothetical protein
MPVGSSFTPKATSVTRGVGNGKRGARCFDAYLRGTRKVAPPRSEVATFDKLNPCYYTDAPKHVLDRLQVISCYPITPQTHIVEGLSAMVKRGDRATASHRFGHRERAFHLLQHAALDHGTVTGPGTVARIASNAARAAAWLRRATSPETCVR